MYEIREDITTQELYRSRLLCNISWKQGNKNTNKIQIVCPPPTPIEEMLASKQLMSCDISTHMHVNIMSWPGGIALKNYSFYYSDIHKAVTFRNPDIQIVFHMVNTYCIVILIVTTLIFTESAHWSNSVSKSQTSYYSHLQRSKVQWTHWKRFLREKVWKDIGLRFS